MQSPGAAVNGMFSTASRSAAASMTVPAEVIHERWGFGDRKNGSTASGVWVSETAENQQIHYCHARSRSSRKAARCASSSMRHAVGGVPARTDSWVTIVSRVENEL